MTTAPQNILLIEDNPADAYLIEDLLSESGQTGRSAAPLAIVHADCLAAGLTRLAEGQIHAVLLDLSLPDSSGFETFTRIMAQAPHLPILVLSGLDDEALAARAVRLGAQDYLVKGQFDGPWLIRALRHALERKQSEEQLEASERRFRALIEHSVDVSALIAVDGTVLYKSPASSRVLGYTPEERVGAPLFKWVHPDDLEAAGTILANVVERPGDVARAEYRIRHRDGSWRWIAATAINLLEQPDVRAIVVNYHDDTERHEAEQALQRSEQEARGLYAAALAIGGETEPAGRLERVVDAVLGLVGADEARVALADEANDEIEVVASRGQGAVPPGERQPPGTGLAGEVLRTGRPVRSADITADSRAWKPRRNRPGLSSWLGVPLRDGDRVFGVLIACKMERNAFADEHERRLLSLAALAETAIREARLLEQVRVELAERERAETSIRYQASLLDTVEQAVIATTPDGTIRYWNRYAELLYGWRAEDVLGRSIVEVTPTSTTMAEAEVIMDRLRAGESWTGEFVVQRHDGTAFPAQVTDTPLLSEDGQLVGIVGVSVDISERRHQEEELRHLATHDPLTGLPNRTLLRDRLDQALLAARRNSTPCALLLLDLDRFKEVNDSLGHHVGDLLLQAVSARLRAAMRDTDTVARLGGDEFAVVLPGTDAAGAVLAAEKLVRSLDASFAIDGHDLVTEASVGVAVSPEHGEVGAELLRRADTAMYAAKRLGQGPVVYTAEHGRGAEGLALLAELRQAIERGELALHYQPKIDLRTGMANCVEALVRWPHLERGLIPPGLFVPLAERTGLIHPLTRWVLGEAVRQLAAWRADGLDVSIAINLSTRNLLDERLPDDVSHLLAQADVPAASLWVEVTESAMMADPATAEQVLRRLDALGVRISVDDFGTGYSSLGYLKRLPVTELKVDQSFVRDLATSPGDLGIMQAAIDLGHHLGLVVVAEGVEDAATAEALTRLSCDVAQGYHFARPMPADEAAAWLHSHALLDSLPGPLAVSAPAS